MKIFRLSKFLLLCLGVALIAFNVAESTAGTPSGQKRNIGDMMARRSGRSSAALPSIETEFSSSSRKARPVKIKAQDKSVVAKEQAKSYKVVDKDGSLFPGGSCEHCNEDPNDKDGSLFPGGSCVNCYNSGPLIDTGPCKACKKPKKKCPVCVKPVAPKPRMVTVAVPYTPIVYQATARDCCSMAPISLEHVDFNLDENEANSYGGTKLGNYRFRIFGCRRYDKTAILNRGRIMQKDMNFNKIFEDVTGDCYNLVDVPQDLCLQTTPSPLPEYVLTAEITNFFMNVCDQYDWQAAQKNETRVGSAEMTVKWRLSNLTKTKVLWEGTTTGYSELNAGVSNGEIKLIEEAFADATSNLQMSYGFEEQLMVRLTPEELSAQRNALIDEEIALNPAKCNYQKELECVKQCQVSRPEFDAEKCPQAILPEPKEKPVEIKVIEKAEPEKVQVEVIDVPDAPAKIIENSGIKSDYAMFNNCIDEKGGVISDGQCMIVDDTWVDVKQDISAINELCIVDRPPYEVLNPENLYKVRASVVEIRNNSGKKGAGLIISESFVLTSANLVEKANNLYNIRTINGKELTGQVVRVNPEKNTALVMLNENTQYTPLSLNLDLPKSGQGGYMVLGILDVDSFQNGENYIDNNGKIVGYRYSKDKGAEIIADTAVQTVTIGGVLIDGHGTINGMAHTGVKTDVGNDLFLPTETALRSVGLSICEKLYEKNSPWQQTVYKPVTEIILKSAPKAPEVLKAEERK